MKRLLEIHDSDIFPNVQNINPANFSERRAVRAVVSNDHGQVALLWVANRAHHKLPGGGIEGDEDLATALDREILEELGCAVQVTGEVGEILEYKNEQTKKQTSFCYTAKQIGKVANPSFTESELKDGMEVQWVQDIDEAIRVIEADQPSDYVGHFIQARDLAFLRATAELPRS